MRHNNHHPSLPSTATSSRRRLLIATSAATLAIVAMTGCGSESPTAEAPAPTAVDEPAETGDPGGTSAAKPSVAAGQDESCRLLTAAEAEAVLGMPVLAGVPTTFDSPGYGSGFDCSYTAADQTAGPIAVHVGVLGTGFPREAWEQAERAEAMTEVDGVGDIAFVDEHNGSMDVLVDGAWLQAQVVNIDEATVVKALTEICLRAIDRI